MPTHENDATVRRLWPSPDPTPLTDEELLAAYAMPEGRQLLRVNFVSSVDGSATIEGRSGGLGDAADRRVFGLLRVACDALLVGAGTVRAEGYGPMLLAAPLRERRETNGRSPNPVLVLVTRTLDHDPAEPIFAKAPQRPIIITTDEAAAANAERFAEVADVLGFGGDSVDLAAALAELNRRGLPHVLCEGGPHLHGSLVEADLVDELALTFAPKLIAGGTDRITAGSPSVVRQMTLAHVLAAGDELLLRYAR